MKPLKDSLGTLKKLVNKGNVCLHLHFKKKGGNRRGKSTMLANVISVEEDHIMVCSKENPKKVLSIALDTNVSKLETNGASFIC
ncbi:MAG: hypothetical protein WC319_03030 [Candidatus Paceibacterota bacterium]